MAQQIFLLSLFEGADSLIYPWPMTEAELKTCRQLIT
jgi:hypothetical protein